MSEWEIGQKVICINDDFAPEYIKDAPPAMIWPVVGGLYTISQLNRRNSMWRWTKDAPFFTKRTLEIGLVLKELPWPHGFDECAFRPADEAEGMAQ